MDDDDASVTRSTTLPAEAGDVWDAVTDPHRLRCWLAAEADLEVKPGGHGRFVDDEGVERRAVVDVVDPGRRLVLRWWPTDRPYDASRVELVLTPVIGRTVVTVTETRLVPATGARAQASVAAPGWIGRLLALGFVARSSVRV